VKDERKRATCLLAILRSILPQDQFQLLFVSAVICFWIAPQLDWGPAFQAAPVTSLRAIPMFAPYAFSFCAATGCLLFFRPVRRPAANLALWVCVPALIGLCAVGFGFILYAVTTASISTHPSVVAIKSLVSFSAGRAAGFRWAICGLLLAMVFTWRVWHAYSSLPLALQRSPELNQAWRRLQTILWILLGGVWKVYLWLVGIASFFVLIRAPSSLHQNWIFYVVVYSLGLVGFIGLAVWANGSEAVTALLGCVRLPAPEMFLLAIALPFCAVMSGSIVRYFLYLIIDKVPHVASLFSFPHPERIASLIPGAFVEEAIFRGFLLPQFVVRYRTLRGVVLVSVVFAAWHCGSDFSVLMSDREVAIQLGIRSLELASGGVIFGWLTIRAGSILPVVVAHALLNAFSGTSMDGSSGSLWSPSQAACISISLGLLAYILWRRWPIHGGVCERLFDNRREENVGLQKPTETHGK
jgi:membrane protease YdiL (CAAX protease family)